MGRNRLVKYGNAWVVATLLLVVGYVVGAIWPHHFDTLLSPSLKELHRLADKTNAFHNPLHTAGVIFLHNLEAATLVMILAGILTIGLYPAWALWVNGVTMGYVAASEALQIHAPAWKIVVFGMLPHGILELPAFIWSASLGMILGVQVIRSAWAHLRSGEATSSLRSRSTTLRGTVVVLIHQFPYIVFLLMAAAAIEGFITPHVIQAVLKPNV